MKVNFNGIIFNGNQKNLKEIITSIISNIVKVQTHLSDKKAFK